MIPYPKSSYILIWLVILLATAASALGAEPVVLQEGVGRYPLGAHLEILEDKEGKLTLPEVLAPDKQGKFSASHKAIPNFGFTRSAYWVRFSLVNPSPKEQLVLFEEAYPHIDSIKLFIYRDGKLIDSATGGDSFPRQNSKIDYRNYSLPILSPPNSTSTIYLRFQTESSMQLPLNLWRPVKFAEKINREQTVLGIYFGVMGAMLLYNLFLFIFLRDKNYLFYILYIGSFTMAQLGVNRLDLEFLWPNWPLFANLSHAVFFNLTFFFGGLFCRSFLDTKQNTRYIDKAILVVMGVCLLGVLLTFVSGYTAGILCVVYFIAILGPIFLLSAGIACWARGVVIARYYTIAWSCFLVGAIIFNLRNIGLLPSIPIIDFSPHIGSAIEVVFLSLALADRINVIKNEKLDAQAKAYAAEKALTEALERKVEEKDNQVKHISGLLPICASCKKIRDDQGYWQQVERYLVEHSDAQFSHGICPDCMKKLYPEVANKILDPEHAPKKN